ncbi:MAG: CarD family transcriptional regulator [Anaerolineales bacterium]|jgi:RNA polymerase-interacting CarD/CdnL/TRCF family regulator
MSESDTAFHVGDQVIHWVYGLGEIIQLDEKTLAGRTGQYYVLQLNDLTLWVPIEETGECHLRSLTPARDFQKLFLILASPGETLSADRHERKMQLAERLKDGKLESICRAIRDLALFKRTNRMNDNDKSYLERARSFLLNEWSVALSVPVQQAESKLVELLEGDMV